MNSVRHEKYENSMNGLPFSLGIDIERSRYNFSKEQNWHENLEIQLFTRGEGSVLLDGEKYNVKKDDIVVVNSNVLHYTFTDTEMVYTCIIISAEWCKRMNIDYDTLCFTPLLNNNKLKMLISKLVDASTNYEDKLRIAKSNEILLNIMIGLVEKYCIVSGSKPTRNKDFERIVLTTDYIHKNFHKKITLSEISKAVIFDKYTLCKEFKKYTGQTIFENLNQYRCMKAIDYLIEGHTVAETAVMCGFENLSYFTKTFKKYIGNTPSKYKANAHP